MSDRYVLAEIAEQDLEEILLRIAEDDLDAALRVDQEFHVEFVRLAENPLIGHTRPDLPSRYRVWHLYSYLIQLHWRVPSSRSTPKALRTIAQGCRRSGYPGSAGASKPTLKGLRAMRGAPVLDRVCRAASSLEETQPLRGREVPDRFTQGRRRGRQPWAVLRNAFGVEVHQRLT